MIDRRGFLTAMLGAAVLPKDVLSGITSPAPVKEAVGEWVSVWRQHGPMVNVNGVMMQAFTIEITIPDGMEHLWPAKVISEAERKKMVKVKGSSGWMKGGTL